MGVALTIRAGLTPEALRRQARHEANQRAALRMLAIANALEGMSRAEAARLAGMERQALRDAVVCYNAEGLAGLYDRPKPGRPPRLSEAEQAVLAARVFRGPDPERDGVCTWPNPPAPPASCDSSQAAGRCLRHLLLPLRALPLARVEVALAEADGVRRDLDQLVVGGADDRLRASCGRTG